ncbi:MAG TPA: hypothetical protein VMV79_02290 [Alphaproteobacteria bacterium]|nr:hypothetical protein [Alphaproteobacteria bacterium]
MRRCGLILALGAILMIVGWSPARGQDVLVPQDNGNTPAPTPDLGFSPATPSGSAAHSAKTQQGGTDAGTTGSAETPTPLLPSGNGDTGTAPAAAPTIGDYSPTPPPMAAHIAGMLPGIPTQIIKMPGAQSSLDPSLPEKLDIDVAGHYVWGPVDVAAVHGRLGIPPDQVAAHCQLAVGGFATSSAGTYSIGVGQGPQTGFSYAGKLTAVNLAPHALCDMGPLPPYAGYVMQYGDKYDVMLMQVPCPPPQDRDVQRVIFHYAGNGKGSCAYQ